MGFKLVAGLGNPGRRYSGTRHNLGFMVVDELSRLRSGALRRQERFEAEVGKLELGGAELVVLKPLTFMNLSGRAVKAVMGFYKVTPEEIIVVHDDIDLAFGKLRLSRGGGDGGHKGVRSICSELGSADFVRVRCGVGRPTPQDGEQGTAVVDWVLEGFSEEEEGALNGLNGFLERGVSALETLCSSGLQTAQNLFNRDVLSPGDA